jgi:Polyketide cyclase / dehydrase and lipid transport
MINVEATTVIDRPVEAVFAFVADLENNPKWESNFIQVKRVSPEPLGVGTVYQCVLRVPGQRAGLRRSVAMSVSSEADPASASNR